MAVKARGAETKGPAPATAARGPARAPVADAPAPRLAQARAAGNQAWSHLAQAKLSIGAVDDPLEREADRAADLVLRAPAPGAPALPPAVPPSPPSAGAGEGTARRSVDASPSIPLFPISLSRGAAPAVQRCGACASSGVPCAKCAEEARKKEERAGVPAPTVRRQALPGGGAAQAPAAFEGRLAALRGGGAPLAPQVRAFFEPRLGADLSAVRVHTGPMASEAARSIHARAFALGSDVVFGAGEYAPESPGGARLLAHELAHVVQQDAAPAERARTVRRKSGPGQPVIEGANASTWNNPRLLPASARVTWIYGVPLANDREFIRDQLRLLIARAGLAGADRWFNQLLHGAGGVGVPIGYAATRAAGGMRVRSAIDLNREVQDEASRLNLTPLVKDVYLKEVRPEAIRFLHEFQAAAGRNVEMALDAYARQARAEWVRYGLSKTTVWRHAGKAGAIKEVRYALRRGDSPEVGELRAAAGVLLARRKQIAALEAEKQAKMDAVYLHDGTVYFETDASREVARKIKAAEDDYRAIRTALSAEYPALAAFSGLDEGTSDLKELATGNPAAIAAVLGEEIDRKLNNIARVRSRLQSGSLNVWTLPTVVRATSVQIGADRNPEWNTLVREQVKNEEPGFWADLALLVLNFAAIALAAPTGGVSLAVAAGVNAVAAGVRIHEYMLQSALAGTAFDRAQALSQDEPSLFWLAVEVVGVFADVGGAAAHVYRSYKALSPLAKAAVAANGTEEAAETLLALQKVARAEGGDKLAARVTARVQSVRRGGAAASTPGLTAAEAKQLGTAARATEQASATSIGRVVTGTAGDVNISRNGLIYTCASPCTQLRARYAGHLAGDDAAAKKFLAELEGLEDEAQKLARARTAAEGNPAAVARVEADAQAVKELAADLEQRIQKEYNLTRTGRPRKAKPAPAAAAPTAAAEAPVAAAPRPKPRAKKAAAPEPGAPAAPRKPPAAASRITPEEAARYERLRQLRVDLANKRDDIRSLSRQLSDDQEALRRADDAYQRAYGTAAATDKGRAAEEANRRVRETGAKYSRARDEARALEAEQDAIHGSPLLRELWEKYDYGDLGRHAPCFAPGTAVFTPAGPRPIEEIAVGERVLSYNFGAGRVVESVVTSTSRGWTRHLAHVAVGGCEVAATLRHPFWSEGEQAWLDARDLHRGMRVRSAERGILEVSEVRTESAVSPTHNLEVEGTHTYFVGAAGVLVHNGVPIDQMESGLERTERLLSRIYVIRDKVDQTIIYVGKTYQGAEGDVAKRFAQHVAQKGLDINRYESKMVAEGLWTRFETAVWEQHFIEMHGGIHRTNPGTPLINDVAAITPDKFREYHTKLGFNPCT